MSEVDRSTFRLKGSPGAPQALVEASSELQVMPELFEHLQAEPSAAERWNRKAARLRLSLACDRRLLACAACRCSKSSGITSKVLQLARSLYEGLRCPRRAVEAEGRPVQIIAHENEIDNGHNPPLQAILPLSLKHSQRGSFAQVASIRGCLPSQVGRLNPPQGQARRSSQSLQPNLAANPLKGQQARWVRFPDTQAKTSVHTNSSSH